MLPEAHVSQSNHFIWDFTGVSAVQAARQMQKQSVWSGFIGFFFVISRGRLQRDAEKSETQIRPVEFP